MGFDHGICLIHKERLAWATWVIILVGCLCTVDFVLCPIEIIIDNNVTKGIHRRSFAGNFQLLTPTAGGLLSVTFEMPLATVRTSLP
jgi:hypothetical protein